MTLRYTIRTPRLELRTFTPSDFNALCKLKSDPEVMRYIRNGVRNSEQTLAELNCYIRDWDYAGFGQFAVNLRESRELIGLCGFTGPSTLGYIFAKEHWGRGFATEAVQACLNFGFEVLQCENIYAGALKKNAASLRVLAKVGMKTSPNEFFETNGGAFFCLSRDDYQRELFPCTLIRLEDWARS